MKKMEVFKKIFIEGERIYLREVQPADVGETYLHWLNDKEVVQYTEIRFRPNTREELQSYVERMANDPKYLFLAIVAKENDKHIGNVKAGPINSFHRFADVGIIIGEKDYWGKGLAAEAIKLVVDYAFNKLHLHKLTAGCYANNLGAVKSFEKAGFQREGLLKKHYLCEGKYVDRVCLGIICPE